MASKPFHDIASKQPGTKPLPDDSQKVVVRLSNPDAMLNNTVRVEIEVAAITLMQDALSVLPTRIVSEVYGWNTAVEGKGWIVQEYMPGQSLSSRFSELSTAQRERVLVQVAHVFKLIQNYELPPTVTEFGDVENILIDPETLQLTAPLDFDFSHIASLGDEYFYSFASFHSIVASPFEGEQETLRQAQLNGFEDFKTPKSQEEVDWNQAKMWHSALKIASVGSPADIEGIEELAASYWFLLDWLKRKTPEQQEELKNEAELNLDKYLKRWGFDALIISTFQPRGDFVTAGLGWNTPSVGRESVG
ncbi:hypothetical protein BDZ45DRAFT_725477 [Acephala macrosclerotiorum]|nr:hypothetical protein BDZ45DRAFT_725477 [Acephala macrosclerotiorum]